jgi:hypothetical protein
VFPMKTCVSFVRGETYAFSMKCRGTVFAKRVLAWSSFQ